MTSDDPGRNGGAESAAWAEPLTKSLLAERAEYEAAAAEARAKIVDVDQKLAAIRVLIGPEQFARLTGEVARPLPQKREGEVTWAAWIEEQLAGAPAGLTSAELVRAARRDPRIADRARRSPTGFYNAATKLVDNERITKSGLLYRIMNTHRVRDE